MSTQASFKLIYFPVRERGELTRTLLHLGGQKFDEVTVPANPPNYPEWVRDFKPKMVFQVVPQLDVTENGVTTHIGQSAAIERYLARRFNLFGRNEIESAKVDMICEEVRDIYTVNIRLRQDIFYGEDKKEKTEKLDKALAEQVPALLKLIQNLYEENQAATGNSGYLVGNGLTYADVALVNAYPWLSDKTEATFNALPHLKQHYEKIRNLPQLKSFYEQRAKVRFSIYLPE